jgi:hypothetical protein
VKGGKLGGQIEWRTCKVRAINCPQILETDRRKRERNKEGTKGVIVACDQAVEFNVITRERQLPNRRYGGQTGER